MLKIRLQRVGRKHEPSFRLVLTDSKNSTKSGKFKELLGSYDPRFDRDSIKEERVKYWLANGAQTSDTAHNLLVKHNLIDEKKKVIKTKPSKKAPKEAPAPKVEASAEGQVEEAEEVEATPSTPEEATEATNDDTKEESPAEETTPDTSDTIDNTEDNNQEENA